MGAKLYYAAAFALFLAAVSHVLLSGVLPPKLDSYATILPDGRVVIDKQLIEGVQEQYPPIVNWALWCVGNGFLAGWLMPFTEESIFAEARKRSGLGEDAVFWYDKEGGETLTGAPNDAASYVNTYWLSHLRVLLKATQEEAMPYLSAFGRYITRDTIIEALSNQLRVVDLIARNPDIAGEVIDRPIIIAGPPRTMTTHAQSILAHHPDTLYFRFTESRDPIQPADLAPELVYTDADPRAKLLKVGRGLLWYIRPFFMYMFRTDEDNPGDSPNEDIFMSMLVFGSVVFETQSYVPSYSKMWHSVDNKPAFRFQKIVQQVIQWQERKRRGVTNKRWLMKTPEHAGCLRDLMKVYPDAFVILTHRDPVPVVASFIPMVTYTAGFWNSKIDARIFGEYELNSLENRMNHLVDDIDSVPSKQVLHVPFARFVNDNYAVIDEICQFTGLSLREDAVSKMKGYIEKSPREGANRFEYRIETFGPSFSRGALRQRFSRYYEKFSEYI